MSPFFVHAFAIFIFMSIMFIVASVRKRNDFADVVWGLGFVFIALIAQLFETAWMFPATLVSILISIWGIRLTWHIGHRHHGKPEDFRYQQWRKEWMQKGRWYFYLRSYLQIFLLQGFFMYMIIFPVTWLSAINVPFDNSFNSWILIILGLFIWITGFLFEVVGDWQLSQFIKNPQNKGKIMRFGLWSRTRHPNYFGEVMQWWGIFLITLPMGYPWSFVAIVSPLLITFLITRVSGIPMLEKKWETNPEYQEYKKNVPGFFPKFFHENET